MKKNIFPALLFAAVLLISLKVQSQQLDCSFKAPVVTIDFGTDASNTMLHVGSFSNYSFSNYPCPEDGYYSFTSVISGRCFNDNWINLPEDHTPGDNRGRMMLVNASYDAGTFFIHRITNLKPATTYEVAAWIINVCSGNWGCTPHPPVLSFTVFSTSGLQLGKFRTGQIWPAKNPNWQRYYAVFTMPPNETGITLKIDDVAEGGCGNDFALDDITLRECRIIEPPKSTATLNKTVAKTTEQKRVTATVSKPSAQPVKSKTVVRTIASVDKTAVNKTALATTATIQQSTLLVPEVLRSRTNTIVKKIEIPATEVLVELYDNGEIDGDTVTVYHNNQLLVNRAGLSTKPVSFKIKIDAQHPHHELVMVANNLGSIPPNTSLMIVTAGNKRYEVFISSTEKQNASVVFDLKE